MVAIAGGRIDLARYTRFCASPARDFTCGPQPEFRGARLVVIPGPVGHYDFVPVCSELGKKAADPGVQRLCHDAPGVDRQRVQNSVAAMALDFFDRNLVPRPD